MSVQAYPCRNRPEAKDFEFWVGEWDIAKAYGASAGSFSINQMMKAPLGCCGFEGLMRANSNKAD